MVVGCNLRSMALRAVQQKKGACDRGKNKGDQPRHPAPAGALLGKGALTWQALGTNGSSPSTRREDPVAEIDVEQ